MGGAILYSCTPESGFACNVTMVHGNYFISNSAKSQGGAITWLNKRYNHDNTIVFENNTAIYGPDYSSYAKTVEVKYITNNDYVNTS